ncbi:MAG: HAD-IA family hydrolase [Novosphingobium sp.]
MSSRDAGQVDAVVFDVGRVLYRWDLRHIFAPVIADAEALDRFVGEVVTAEWHFQCDAGRELDAMIAERCRTFPQHAELIARYRENFLDSIPGPVAGSLELVEALHARGVPLYAITNFGAEFWQRFRATAPVFDRFGDVVVSGVEKLAKPDPAIFALAAARFGHAPGRMLFVDDVEANVRAAEASGWQVHHFHDAAGLEADLRARKVL